MSDDLGKDRAWQWALHEDALFDSRLQVFLTAHGLLVTAAGFTVSKDSPSSAFLVLLAVFGLFLGTIWIFVQVQSKRIVARLERELAGTLFSEVFKDLEHGPLTRLSRNPVMSFTIPPLVTLWWAVFLLFVCLHWF